MRVDCFLGNMFKIQQRWVLATLALVLGCAASLPSTSMLRIYDGRPDVHRELPIYYSFACSFPDKFRDDVREGATYWNQILKKTIFVERKECAVDASVVSIFLGHAEDGKSCFAISHPHVMENNVKVHTGAIVFFPIWLAASEASRKSVSRHEFGHLLGFDHSHLESGCLMYEALPDSLTVPKEACPEEIREIWPFYNDDIEP